MSEISKIYESEKLNNALKNIKAIALDLDGTTLTRAGLTRRTKETLEYAIRKGYKVVIATGRPYVALPESVLDIEGLEYIIISNGAHIVNKLGEFLYSNYMSPDASLKVMEALKKMDFPIEVFTKGQAFVDRGLYQDLKEKGSSFMSAKYVLRTRKPVDNIYGFFEENQKEIENINIHFQDLDERRKTWKFFNEFKDITVTSSQRNNIELGGKTTSKATALSEFCKIHNIKMENVMAFGDSENDLKMMEASGFACAVNNAVDVIKDCADYVTLSSEEEGVCYAIRNLLFKGEEIDRKSDFSGLKKFFKRLKSGRV